MTKKELLKILEGFNDDAIIVGNHPTTVLFISDEENFLHRTSCKLIFEAGKGSVSYDGLEKNKGIS
jgi:hypothetical protein